MRCSDAVEMVERGEIQEVMEMLPILSDPGFEHILCEMRYQRFIELVRADKLLGPNGALVYAQQHFSNGNNDARALVRCSTAQSYLSVVWCSCALCSSAPCSMASIWQVV